MLTDYRRRPAATTTTTTDPQYEIDVKCACDLEEPQVAVVIAHEVKGQERQWPLQPGWRQDVTANAQRATRRSKATEAF